MYGAGSLRRTTTSSWRYTRDRADARPQQLSLDAYADFARVLREAETSAVPVDAERLQVAQPEGAPRARPGETIRVLGAAITDQLADTGHVTFRGLQIERCDPASLAMLLQPVRNPRFEVFRVFATRGNEIVGEETVTVRLPGAAPLRGDAICMRSSSSSSGWRFVAVAGFYAHRPFRVLKQPRHARAADSSTHRSVFTRRRDDRLVRRPRPRARRSGPYAAAAGHFFRARHRARRNSRRTAPPPFAEVQLAHRVLVRDHDHRAALGALDVERRDRLAARRAGHAARVPSAARSKQRLEADTDLGPTRTGNLHERAELDVLRDPAHELRDPLGCCTPTFGEPRLRQTARLRSAISSRRSMRIWWRGARSTPLRPTRALPGKSEPNACRCGFV